MGIDFNNGKGIRMNLKTKIAMVGALSAVLLSGCSGDKQKKKPETVPQPDYLTVKQWEHCLTSKTYEQDGKGWIGYCMPVKPADCCPQKAWDKLQTKNIPACSANTGFKVVRPDYVSVQDFKTCLKSQSNDGWLSYCMPDKNALPTQCQQSTYDKIAALKDVPKCLKLELAAPAVTTVQGVTGYQDCVIKTNGTFCLISKDATKKPTTCTDAAFQGVTAQLLALEACESGVVKANTSLAAQITKAKKAVDDATNNVNAANVVYTATKSALDEKPADSGLVTATKNAKAAKETADKALTAAKEKLANLEN
jgi:hypothetical protein